MTRESLLVVAAGVAVLGVLAFRKRRRAHGVQDAVTRYTIDLTAQARAGALDPICCREAELERVLHVLLRRTKNNPLIIGEPGVGKSAIVEAFAQRIVAGSVPKALAHARVLVLRLEELMAGTRYRGEYEARIQQLLAALTSAREPVILFIDEVHLLEQPGRSEGSLSLTDVLKPELARGDVRVIGATTWREYEQFIRPNEALDRRFQLVLVDEPTRERALTMLRGLRATYEAFHNVTITNAALEASVRLADERIDTRRLPDSAIDLVDEAAAKVAIEAERAHHVPLGVIHAAAKGKASGATERAIVDVDDIESVVEQWVMHGRTDRERDARSGAA